MIKTIIIVIAICSSLFSKEYSEEEMSQYREKYYDYLKQNNKMSFSRFKEITGKYSKEEIESCIINSSKKYDVPIKVYDSIIHIENGAGYTYTMNCNTNIKGYSKKIENNYLNYLYCGKNIDVGYSQINLKVWSKYYPGLTDEILLDPCNNIELSFKIVKDHYKETKNWIKAIGYYHSRTPKHFNRYTGLVIKYLKEKNNNGSN
jgi:hypothetical protein